MHEAISARSRPDRTSPSNAPSASGLENPFSHLQPHHLAFVKPGLSFLPELYSSEFGIHTLPQLRVIEPLPNAEACVDGRGIPTERAVQLNVSKIEAGLLRAEAQGRQWMPSVAAHEATHAVGFVAQAAPHRRPLLEGFLVPCAKHARGSTLEEMLAMANQAEFLRGLGHPITHFQNAISLHFHPRHQTDQYVLGVLTASLPSRVVPSEVSSSAAEINRVFGAPDPEDILTRVDFDVPDARWDFENATVQSLYGNCLAAFDVLSETLPGFHAVLARAHVTGDHHELTNLLGQFDKTAPQFFFDLSARAVGLKHYLSKVMLAAYMGAGHVEREQIGDLARSLASQPDDPFF